MRRGAGFQRFAGCIGVAGMALEFVSAKVGARFNAVGARRAKRRGDPEVQDAGGACRWCSGAPAPAAPLAPGSPRRPSGSSR